MQANLQIYFDLHGGFTRYHGQEGTQFHHEAAFDAFMTGYIFAQMIKFKEIFEMNKAKKEEGTAGVNLRGTAVNLGALFPESVKNQVRLNQLAVLNLDPLVKQEEKYFGQTLFFKAKKTEALKEDFDAKVLAEKFSKYGDCNIFKKTEGSGYLEFFTFKDYANFEALQAQLGKDFPEVEFRCHRDGDKFDS